MLYLDRPIGPLRGLQIYRDHADPNMFYYVSERPRLAMNDGVPEFVYLKYARDITDNPAFSDDDKASLGGGLLAFTVDLSIDQDELDAIKNELAQYSGGGSVTLSPIMFEDGTVRLSMVSQSEDGETTATSGRLQIIETTWGASKPSLYGNNRATFGVGLSQEGATLLEEALKYGVGFIGVIYDLKFLGMRPSFNVKVTANYSRIYNHFEAEVGVQAQIKAVQLAAEVGVGFQKLVDDGSIKIEVTTFTNDEDLKNQADAALEWAKAKITEDLFKSSLTPPGFMARTVDPLTAMMTSLSSAMGGAVSNVAPNPRAPAPATPVNRPPTPTPPATSGGSPPATPAVPATGTAPAATGSAPARGGLGLAPSRTSSTGGNSVDRPEAAPSGGSSNAAGGGENTRTGSVMPFKVALSLKYYRQEELKTRVFEYNKQAAEERIAAPQGLFTTLIEGHDLSSRILEINLDDDFFKRLVSDVGVVCDWENDGIELVNINTEYPGNLADGEDPDHVDGYIFKPEAEERKEFTTWLNDSKDMSYRYKADVHFKNSSPWVGKDAVLHGEWESTRVRQLVFNPLDKIGLLTVNVAADNTIDFQVVQQVEVEIQYDDPGNDFSIEHSFLLTGDHKTDVWKVRLSDRQKRSFRWRAIYSLTDNVETTSDWTETEDTMVIVGSPFEGSKRIRLTPTLKAEDIIEAVVDLEYRGESGYRKNFQEVFTPDDMRGRTIRFGTLLKDPASYTYEIIVIRADGSDYFSDRIESDKGVIIVDDKEGQEISLNVKLLAEASHWSTLHAVEVIIQESEGVTDSLLFTESQAGDRTHIIGLSVDASLEYQWRLVSYFRDGTKTETEFVTESDRNLVVPLS